MHTAQLWTRQQNQQARVLVSWYSVHSFMFTNGACIRLRLAHNSIWPLTSTRPVVIIMSCEIQSWYMHSINIQHDTYVGSLYVYQVRPMSRCPYKRTPRDRGSLSKTVWWWWHTCLNLTMPDEYVPHVHIYLPFVCVSWIYALRANTDGLCFVMFIVRPQYITGAAVCECTLAHKVFRF